MISAFSWPAAVVLVALSATVAPDSRDLAVREVVALHEFIEQWSRAELPNEDSAYRRFSAALSDDFVLLGPDGERMTAEEVRRGFRSAHGRWSGVQPARVEIRAIRVRAVAETLAVIEYEEWHFVGDAETGRRSTVVLRRSRDAPGGMLWLHLHETWIGGANAP